MASYFGVIGNRDYIKFKGQRRPFWEFLDEQPTGWLCSLAYNRVDMPNGLTIRDCGAWSYKSLDTPKLGKNLVTPEWAIAEYSRVAQSGDIIIAPDHMLIPGVDFDSRREFNRQSASTFIKLCPAHFKPMAAVHGVDLQERIEYGHYLIGLGYEYLALGGLAGQASKRQMIFEVVSTMRREFPGVWIHVLGLSSPGYAAEWQRLGIESFDGASHFKQAFTAGKFFIEWKGALVSYPAARPGQPVTAPLCDCLACSRLRTEGIDTRSYGSNEHNMGRAAHNLNHLMRAIKISILIEKSDLKPLDN